MSALVVSLGVGPCVHLSFERDGDGVRLRVQVGDDEVADVEVSAAELAAICELTTAV
jgi:hypothetical protein